ncbi:MAG: type II toxin-antitoxin system prevent-host-death family antitoxin [Trueperaceae bacterium]|nr:type II toxin-antitoxin system prevent-host-death family antitoxin [Trueperaceae bacterium]
MSSVKNNLSSYLDLVRAGEAVLITDRGRPIARLVPLDAAASESIEARRIELERRGVLNRAEAPHDPEILRHLPPIPSVDGDLLVALLHDREEDR